MAQVTKSNADPYGQIQDMLKAYYPVLYLTTFEYDRANRYCQKFKQELPVL